MPSAKHNTMVNAVSSLFESLSEILTAAAHMLSNYLCDPFVSLLLYKCVDGFFVLAVSL